jgi:hypothetical protein
MVSIIGLLYSNLTENKNEALTIVASAVIFALMTLLNMVILQLITDSSIRLELLIYIIVSVSLANLLSYYRYLMEEQQPI